MRYLLSIGFICLLFSARSQNNRDFSVGYLIKKDGTAKAGYILEMDSLPSNICYFKDSLHTPIQKLTPDQINGYGFIRGRTFISHKTSNDASLFFETLDTQNPKLFKALNVYLIQDSSRKFHELTRSNYKRVLGRILADCPYASTRISLTKFTTISIRDILEEYRACKESPSEYFSGIYQVKVRVGLFVGFSGTTTQPSNSNDITQFSKVSVSNSAPYVAGAIALANFAHRAPRWAFRTGISYVPQKYAAVRSSSGGGAEDDVSFTELQVPVGLQFRAGEVDRKHFFIRAGIFVPFVTNLKSSSISDTYSGNTVYIQDGLKVTSISNAPGLQLGLGYGIPAFKKSRFFFDISYQQRAAICGLENANQFNVTFSSFSITGGFIY